VYENKGITAICIRLEAFLRQAGKSGYYTDDSLPTVAAL